MLYYFIVATLASIFLLLSWFENCRGKGLQGDSLGGYKCAALTALIIPFVTFVVLGFFSQVQADVNKVIAVLSLAIIIVYILCLYSSRANSS